MLKFGIAVLLGGAGLAAGYFFHQLALAPRGLTPWVSQGSPWVTGAIVAAAGVIVALMIRNK